MQSQRIRPYFLILALVAAAMLAAAILWPFLKPLALAAVFAVVLQGIYGRISASLKSWPSVAAFLTVVVSIILILLPLSLIGVLVGQEARSLYVSLEEGGGRTVVADLLTYAEQKLGPVVPGFNEFIGTVSADLDLYTKEVLKWVAGHAGDLFGSASRLLLAFFIFFIALYYLLRDGKRVRNILIELSPLSDKEDEGILDRLERAINSTIKGSLSIALIQGLLTTLGFLLFSVPSAILWGSVAAVAALIPGVGTALVFIPAVAFLFFTGATLPALGLLIWGALAVGLIDNLLGPHLIGSGMRLHPLLVLLSVLGGIMYFGVVGVFLGPLALALLFALLSIYADVSKMGVEKKV